jgi:rRNA maturation protein Nop10
MRVQTPGSWTVRASPAHESSADRIAELRAKLLGGETAARPPGVERCPICGGTTKGGHERDGSDHCWGHSNDED